MIAIVTTRKRSSHKNKLYHPQSDNGVVKQRIIQKIAESGLAYHDLENLFSKAGKEALVAVLSKAPTKSKSTRSPRGTNKAAILSNIIHHFESKWILEADRSEMTPRTPESRTSKPRNNKQHKRTLQWSSFHKYVRMEGRWFRTRGNSIERAWTTSRMRKVGSSQPWLFHIFFFFFFFLTALLAFYSVTIVTSCANISASGR